MTVVLIRKKETRGRYTHTGEERPREDRMRKWLSASQGKRAQGKPNQPPVLRDNKFSLFKPPSLCYY